MTNRLEAYIEIERYWMCPDCGHLFNEPHLRSHCDGCGRPVYSCPDCGVECKETLVASVEGDRTILDFGDEPQVTACREPRAPV